MVEANRILSEDSKYPTIISDFNVKTTFSVTIELEEKRETVVKREGAPVILKQLHKPLKFSTLRLISPEERLITGFKEELGLTIETRIIPVPRTVTPS